MEQSDGCTYICDSNIYTQNSCPSVVVSEPSRKNMSLMTPAKDPENKNVDTILSPNIMIAQLF